MTASGPVTEKLTHGFTILYASTTFATVRRTLTKNARATRSLLTREGALPLEYTWNGDSEAFAVSPWRLLATIWIDVQTSNSLKN